MNIKYNLSLFKNKKIGIGNIQNFIKARQKNEKIVKQIKMNKNEVIFYSESSNIKLKLEIFNKMLIRQNNDIIWFIYNEQYSSSLIGFSMYDTYGFPIDLTEEILLEKGILLDKIGFQLLCKLQKEMSNNTFKNKNAFS